VGGDVVFAGDSSHFRFKFIILLKKLRPAATISTILLRYA
jgi:hypothetical protein